MRQEKFFQGFLSGWSLHEGDPERRPQRVDDKTFWPIPLTQLNASTDAVG